MDEEFNVQLDFDKEKAINKIRKQNIKTVFFIDCSMKYASLNKLYDGYRLDIGLKGNISDYDIELEHNSGRRFLWIKKL